MRLIVTDLDNTLLTSEKTITKHTADVLNRCKARNIRIAFATARPERAVLRFLSAIEPDYILSNNGATITKGPTLLYNKIIAPEISAGLFTALREEKAVTAMTIEVGHCLYTNYVGPPWEEGWNPVYHDFTALPEGDVVKISTECRRVDRVRKILENHPELHLYENTGEAWQQIMHKDATKLNAIRQIAKAMQIELSQVAAFGDDHNDMEMIAHCGVGVAVGQAIAAVKRAADFICGGNDEDGVACWLETHVLQ